MLIRPNFARVHSDHNVGEFAQQSRETARAIAFSVLGPSDQSIVGDDLQERKDAPAGIGVQVFEARDFHGDLPLLDIHDVHQGRAAHEPAEIIAGEIG